MKTTQNKLNQNSKVLVIDDEKDIRDSLVDILGDEQIKAYSVENGLQALEFLKENKVDCILSDVWMPKIDGINLIKQIRYLKNYENVPIIMISGHGTVESAVEATKKGAYNFIEKPLSIDNLILCVQNALSYYELIKENKRLINEQNNYVDPVGHSALFKQKIDQAIHLAKLPNFVLIFGEIGTGKKTFARFIHNQCEKQKQVYLVINIDDNIIKDANLLFKNIDEIKQKYQSATIVIENFDFLPSEFQQKLINLNDGHNNYRIILIAKNDQSLSLSIKNQTMHQSLYLPALRENLEDLNELIRFYTDTIINQEKVKYRHFSLAAQNLLRNYHWPNNIEELIYILRKLLVLGGNIQIEAQEVESFLEEQSKSKTSLGQFDFSGTLRQTRDEFERQYFLHHLRKIGGSIAKLSKISGMERTSLHRKIKQLNINYKDF